MGRDGYLPLFETREANRRIAHRFFSLSILVGICLIWVYRASHVPEEEGRWAWIGLFGAELWFSFYWVMTESLRWNRVYRYTFKDRLSHRYESELPDVDIFVCTADPIIEPPTMVINTVLSVMAYDYPPEKLSVYLSDDGGSELMFYALLEASCFSKHWLPFCKKFKVDPTSPVAYFSNASHPLDPIKATEYSSIEELYKSMENRIKTATDLGRIPEEIRSEHKGFVEWDRRSNSRDHQTILQILIDRRDSNAVDTEGKPLPTLVYVAREKRPQYHHNFKAGAMNALIRVSSKISNGPIILNVDCDMYSNNSNSVKDALCFFMDEENGHDIAYVQHPQSFDNATKNDVYESTFRVNYEVELPGMDGYGGPLYIGTGCFHRRDTLCGRKYNKIYKREWKTENDIKVGESLNELEERLKDLASCTYEKNTQWGKEMGLKYGCAVEDVITGLSIQCRGWKSVYFNPARKGFLGVAPVTLVQALVQHKRWAEGHLELFFSRYNPFWQGYGRIKAGLQMGYCTYNLWSINCIATLYYVSIPSLCFLKGISLFPKISSPWTIPFAYLVIAQYTSSLVTFLRCGGTLKSWWNEQRMWMFRRTTSFLFAFIDFILKELGFAKSAFVITAKVADQDVLQRYEQEIMEFGISSPMFTILATLSLLNLFSLVGGTKRVLTSFDIRVEPLSMQILLCGVLVFINLPVYQGLFFRKDKGRIPTSITFRSVALAIFVCISSLY